MEKSKQGKSDREAGPKIESLAQREPAKFAPEPNVERKGSWRIPMWQQTLVGVSASPALQGQPIAYNQYLVPNA
jgi:hypothetical protein